MNNTAQLAATGPQVGIVWGVGSDAAYLVIVSHRTPLVEGEAYGACITHSRSHYQVWEAWRRLGPAGLARRGLPGLIAWHEYEYFPRGRIVHYTADGAFTFYADRRLHAPDILARIVTAFGLAGSRWAVRSDPHYRAVRDL